ncbi:OLC1v1011686C1 [Oldenlandia corymbosa var. corymbosa]|uniref:OLC1v1011686C1 n=1 Tax=Oldenlandia corymbosa var. corymbosa TaxID=529605 RepID=A0AAV1DUA2_OLDCO|nr:OLC1v1011686C1 [Oldenlandia corymbosa var. corymbosa]
MRSSPPISLRFQASRYPTAFCHPDNMGSTARPDPSIDSLLDAAKHHLSHRSFEECRSYASKALDASPNHPAPAQLLAISSVLSVCSPPPSAAPTESPPDWYAVLGLPRFSQDLKFTRARFELLYGLVDPEKNPYPFAAEARGWVLKAGAALADPDLKSQFDQDLRTRKRDAGKVAGGTFWTVCPYCYFMYEYESVFLDCALRCYNPNCKRPFSAAAVAAAAAPRPDVVAKGKYVCGGFIPLGTNNAGDGGDEEWNWWEAFVTLGSGSGTVNESRQDDGQKSKTENPSGGVDLTEDGGKKAGEEIKKKGNDVKSTVWRKKQAATGKKKVMGKGIRAKWNSSPLAGEECGGEGMIFYRN